MNLRECSTCFRMWNDTDNTGVCPNGHEPAEAADFVTGECPDIPARSGAAAVLDATKVVDDVIVHGRNLQAAVDDIRTWCHGKHTVGAVEITNILRSHHV